MATIAVLGSGAWGTTLAIGLAAKGDRVMLWEHHPERALAMRRDGENALFLPGAPLPANLRVTSDVAEALTGVDLVLFVTPAQQARANARRVAALVPPGAVVVTGSKGLEVDTFARMTRVLAAELPGIPSERIGALSGPNLAHEVVKGKPAASVVAIADSATARQAQEWLTTHTMRVYSTDDVVGVEIGGALKNVIAIAIGVSDGLGFGDNTKAALMTRGLAEISRLAVTEGANPMTMAGLAGLGDLIATCSSPLSRNYSLGYELATTGRTLGEILAGRRSVTEGVTTARAALQLAASRGVVMPLTQSLCQLFDGEDASKLVEDLMKREPRPERDPW